MEAICRQTYTVRVLVNSNSISHFVVVFKCGQLVADTHKTCVSMPGFHEGQWGLQEKMECHLQWLQGGQGHEHEVWLPTIWELPLVSTGRWVHVQWSQCCLTCSRKYLLTNSIECRWTEVHNHIGYQHYGAEEWGEHIKISGTKTEGGYFHRTLHR